MRGGRIEPTLDEIAQPGELAQNEIPLPKFRISIEDLRDGIAKRKAEVDQLTRERDELSRKISAVSPGPGPQ